MTFFGIQRVEFMALLGCVTLASIIFELVRRNRIKERYSLLWFGTCATVLLMSINRTWVEKFSALIGVYYAPNSIFLVVCTFMIMMLVHFSVVISQLLTQNQKLAQKVAILETELESRLKRTEDQLHLNTQERERA